MRLILAAVFALITSPLWACGPETDCTVLGDRTYRYYAPEGSAPMGAFFHAHGYRGTAAGAMRNHALRALADRLNLAFVALNADADDWNLAYRPQEPGQTEAREYDYVSAVIDDLAGRIALDRERLIATGFSAGGMMTWTLACGMGDTFAGFVPYSGTFWRNIPATCPTPAAHLIHIHGDGDTVVPLEGRRIGQTRQGNVYDALSMYAAHGGQPEATLREMPEEMSCFMRENAEGVILDFCLFGGSHSYSSARIQWALERILDRL